MQQDPIDSQVNYPRGQIDFPAEKYRELAKLNLQLSILSIGLTAALVGIGWFLYNSLVRTGGPDAGSVPAMMLKNFPVVFTLVLALVTYIFYRPLKRISELMNWSIYTPALVSVFTAIFLPTGLGIIFIKSIQLALKREFYRWKLPLAWFHYWPKFVNRRIDRLAKNIAAENERISRPVQARAVSTDSFSTENLASQLDVAPDLTQSVTE